MSNHRNRLLSLFLLTLLSALMLSGCSGSGSGSTPGGAGYSGTGTAGGACEGYCYTLSPEAESGRVDVPKSVLPGYGPAAHICVTGDNSSYRAYTDEKGYFRIDGIPAGSLTLTFSGEGLKTTSLTVTVSQDATTVAATPGYDAVLIPPGDDSPRKGEWTYICYIASDSNLSTISEDILRLMETVGSSDSVHIIAFIDMPETNTKMYYLEKDSDSSSISSPYYDYGKNEDSGDYRVFEKFAQDAAAYYPSRHYILDIWNHGSGPCSRRLSTTSPGDGSRTRDVCFDYSSDTQITMPQLKESLLFIREQLGKNIEILIISCCYMGGYETFYQIRDSVDYCIASPPPIVGNYFLPFQPYDVFLERISSNPSVSVATLTEGLAFDTFNEHKKMIKDEPCAFTAVSLSKIGPVHEHFTLFARECNQALSEPAYKKELQAMVKKPFTEGYEDFYLRDLGLFAESVSMSEALPQSLKDAAAAMASDLKTGAQAFKFYGEAYTYPNYYFDWSKCYLVSIYLPYDDSFPLPPSYQAGLDTSATTEWDSFADALWK